MNYKTKSRVSVTLNTGERAAIDDLDLEHVKVQDIFRMMLKRFIQDKNFRNKTLTALENESFIPPLENSANKGLDRQEVLKHYAESGSITETAEYFDVNRSTIYDHIDPERKSKTKLTAYFEAFERNGAKHSKTAQDLGVSLISVQRMYKRWTDEKGN